jgi:hypothetical protein
MLALTLPFLLAAHPGAMLTPLDFARLRLADAIWLQNRPVVVWFHADAPAFTMNGVTITGPGRTPDGIERAAHLGGDHDIGRGERLRVSGVLSVIAHHPRAGGFTEIRIADAELAP